MNYKTQGFIKEINLMTGMFTVDPVPPYAFDGHDSNGASKKHMLFVLGDAGDANIKAVVASAKLELKLPASIKGGVDLLIAMRHEHDKLEIEIDEKKLTEEAQTSVSVTGLNIVK